MFNIWPQQFCKCGNIQDDEIIPIHIRDIEEMIIGKSEIYMKHFEGDELKVTIDEENMQKLLEGVKNKFYDSFELRGKSEIKECRKCNPVLEEEFQWRRKFSEELLEVFPQFCEENRGLINELSEQIRKCDFEIRYTPGRKIPI